MIGNWLSVEFRISCCSSGLPCSTKPRIEVASSSSGKIATNA